MPLFFLLLLLELDGSEEADWSLELEPAAAPLSLEELDFWPERLAAGVLLAFSCESPEELMCDFALSSPVDFDEDVPLLSLELVADEEALGLKEEAPPPLFIDALSWVEELPLAELPFVDALPFIDELLEGALL